MYLILSDADDNETPEVFHNRVDVIGLRAAGKEKGRWKRSDREGHRRSNQEDSTKKIHQRRSDREELSEKNRLQRFVGEDPTEKISRKRSN